MARNEQRPGDRSFLQAVTGRPGRVDSGQPVVQGPDGNRPTRARRSNTVGFVSSAVLGLALGFSGGSLANTVLDSRSSDHNANLPAATGTPTPTREAPTPVPTALATPRPTDTPAPTASAKIEQAPAEIALIRFESKKQVAERFGNDPYTKDPEHWELAENNTAAVLITDQSDKGGYPYSDASLHWGIEHQVKMAGGVAQGYDKIKKTKDGLETFKDGQVLNAQAQAEVVNPNVLEADFMKVTIRVAQNPADTESLYRKLLADQKALEAKTQPDTSTLPENECPTALAGSYALETIDSSKTVAAERWGADTYTSDPSHWEIFNVNGDKGAHLLPDTSDPAHWGVEHKIKTAGAVVQGYNKIKRDKTGIEIGAPGPVVNNAQAEAKVIHPNVTEAVVMEATFRVAVGGTTETGALATNALWRDSLIKQRQAELNQQPNTLSMPVNECVIPDIKSGSTPTPSPTPSPTPNFNKGSTTDHVALR